MSQSDETTNSVPLLALFRGQVPHGDQSAGEPDEDLGARLPDGKIGSLPFLGLRQGGGRGAQSKERKGSNFAA